MVNKIKLIVFVFFFIFNKLATAIEPVEIGKPFQKDVEINFSIIENINKSYEKKLIINKDIRTKIDKNKEKENVVIKRNNKKKEIQIEDLGEKKFARIKEIINDIPNEIQIFFNTESANIKNEDANKIKNFINQTDKKNLKFKITSYAKTDKTGDISRRLSLDRAINIRSILINEGIPAKNLIVKSFGDSKNKENKVIIEFEKK